MATPSEVSLSEFIIAQVNITGPEWDTLTDDQKLDWHYACGTGPYILTEYVADNHYTFAKNENYYDYDERYPENKLPYLDTIKYEGESTCLKCRNSIPANISTGRSIWRGSAWISPPASASRPRRPGTSLHPPAGPESHPDAGTVPAGGGDVMGLGSVEAMGPGQIAYGIAQIQPHIRAKNNSPCRCDLFARRHTTREGAVCRRLLCFGL